jgi:hypothetical protein
VWLNAVDPKEDTKPQYFAKTASSGVDSSGKGLSVQCTIILVPESIIM